MRLNQRLRAAENAGRTAVDLVPVGIVGAAGVAAITGVAGIAAGVAAGATPTTPTASSAPIAAVTTPTTANIATAAPASAPIITSEGVDSSIAIARATLTQAPRGTSRRRGTPDSNSEDNDAASRPTQRRCVSMISRLSRRIGITGRDDGHRSHPGREVEEHAESLAPATLHRRVGNTHSDVPRDAGVMDTAGSSAGSANDAENTDNVSVEDDETEVAPSTRRTSQAMSEARETLRNIPRTRASIAPSIAGNNNEDDKDDGEGMGTLSAPPPSGTRARGSAASALSNEFTTRYPQRIGGEIHATPFRPIRRSSPLNPGGRVADQTRSPFAVGRSVGLGAAGTSGVGSGDDGAGDTGNADPVTPANATASGVGSGNDGASDAGNESPVTPADVELASDDASEGEDSDEVEEKEEEEEEEEKAEEEEEDEEELKIETESIPALPPRFNIHASRSA